MWDKKKYHREYYHKNKKRFKGYLKKYQQSEKGKKKIKEYMQEYYQRPNVIQKRKERDKKRYYKDDQRKIYVQINKQIRRCILMMQKNGKINVKEITLYKYKIIYRIDLHKIIKKLQPFPKNIQDYELDHIIPISKFDLTKRDQIKKAYNPNNLQLLTHHENKKKTNFIST